MNFQFGQIDSILILPFSTGNKVAEYYEIEIWLLARERELNLIAGKLEKLVNITMTSLIWKKNWEI